MLGPIDRDVVVVVEVDEIHPLHVVEVEERGTVGDMDLAEMLDPVIDLSGRLLDDGGDVRGMGAFFSADFCQRTGEDPVEAEAWIFHGVDF